MKELSVYDMTVPATYGQSATSAECYALVTEEIAKGWMFLGGAFGGHSVVGRLIDRFGLDEANQSWARRFADALDQFGDAQAYLNFRSEPADEATLQASHGPDRYQRLRRLKGRLDPDNRFRLNHNIHP